MNEAPRPRDAFFGRHQELEQLACALSDARLVTLVGPGGIGKTRIAREFCAADEDWSRRWFVTLAERSENVPEGVAAVMNVPGQERISRVLAHGETLLVLDNLEHLIDEAAAWVCDMLDRAPGLKVIATSREPMGIRGERVIRVGPLDENAAAKLFVERAGARGVTLSEADVAPLLEQVGGMPLAIELAASRAATMTPEQIAQRLEQRGVELLSTKDRDRPDRQRTVRAAIDWSWRLLDDDEKAALAQCAAFRGGFDLDAAEALLRDCGEPWEVLDSLLMKSLIVNPNGDRFQMLEPIRLYASERLAERPDHDAVYRRHAEHFAYLGWNGRIGRCPPHEHANLAAAHSRVRHDIVLAADLTRTAEYALRTRRAMSELHELATSALQANESASGEKELRARALLLRSRGGAHLGSRRLDAAASDLEEAASIAERLDSDELRADILSLWATVHAELGEVELAGEFAKCAFEAAERSGFDDLRIDAHHRLALARVVRGEWREAVGPCQEAIQIAERIGDEQEAGRVWAALAMIQKHVAPVEIARRSFDRALELHYRYGDDAWTAVSEVNLADLLMRAGEWDEARVHYERGHEVAVRLGEPVQQSAALIGLGTLVGRTGGNPRELLHSAVDAMEGLDAYYERGRAYSVLGIWELTQSRSDLADDLFSRAIDSLTPVGDMRWLGLLSAHRACAAAIDGEEKTTQACIDHAVQTWKECGADDLLSDIRALELACRALLDGAEPQPNDDVQQRIDELNEHPSRGIAWLADNHVATWFSCRPAPLTEAPVLGLAHDARHVTLPDGSEPDFSRRGPLRLMLLALARTHESNPGRCLTVDDLVAAGYPDEVMTPESGRARVHTAVRRLRKLGFSELLMTRDEGYLLDPVLAVQFHEPG